MSGVGEVDPLAVWVAAQEKVLLDAAGDMARGEANTSAVLSALHMLARARAALALERIASVLEDGHVRVVVLE